MVFKCLQLHRSNFLNILTPMLFLALDFTTYVCVLVQFSLRLFVLAAWLEFMISFRGLSILLFQCSAIRVCVILGFVFGLFALFMVEEIIWLSFLSEFNWVSCFFELTCGLIENLNYLSSLRWRNPSLMVFKCLIKNIIGLLWFQHINAKSHRMLFFSCHAQCRLINIWSTMALFMLASTLVVLITTLLVCYRKDIASSQKSASIALHTAYLQCRCHGGIQSWGVMLWKPFNPIKFI